VFKNVKMDNFLIKIPGNVNLVMKDVLLVLVLILINVIHVKNPIMA
jgi:hypothetical protein